jgi:hypothetical protein
MGLLLNLFTPWDYFWALLAERLLRQAARELPAWLETWFTLKQPIIWQTWPARSGLHFPGALLLACSLCSGWSELGHLLIPPTARVRNDFAIRNSQVVIITGSNMAGKSTFIKTIGINLVLALCGGPVDAAYLPVISPGDLHAHHRSRSAMDSLTSCGVKSQKGSWMRSRKKTSHRCSPDRRDFRGPTNGSA